MLYVKVELWPFGDGDKAKQIAAVVIGNDMTGTPERGNYNVRLANNLDGSENGTPVLRGRVENWDRSRPVTELVSAAIESVKK